MNKEAQRLNNLATRLFKDGKRATAKALIKKSLNLDPHSECSRCNYAVLLTNYGEYAAAKKIFDEVLAKNNDSILGWHGYGVLSLVSQHPDYAAKCFKECIRLEPANGSHKFDYACSITQAGKWKEGFELYECRKQWKPEREFSQFLPWTGEHGKKIYVWCEQGIGDSIQYSRYLSWLVNISAQVTFAVPPDLYELFKDFNEICRLVPLTGAMVDADYQVPLMSLAHFYMQEDFIDVPLPSSLWKTPNRSDDSVFDVGLCWACSSTSINYLERSIPFEELLQLTEINNTRFHSVQVGSSIKDITDSYAQNLVIDHSAFINEDWNETRGVLANCNYVVATDTSVAHLAASMNIPTIMFLARRDWWRWGNEGNTTPWYPSMTIIRQKIPFKWENEIKQAYAILETAAKNRQSETLAA